MKAGKECDFGHHLVCGVHFQKPGKFSFGLGQPLLGTPLWVLYGLAMAMRHLKYLCEENA
jgi:hypothetical protein